MKKNNNINIDEQLKILNNVLSLVTEGKVDISAHDVKIESVKKCYDWFSQAKGVKSSILKADIEDLSAKCSELEK